MVTLSHISLFLKFLFSILYNHLMSINCSLWKLVVWKGRSLLQSMCYRSSTRCCSPSSCPYWYCKIGSGIISKCCSIPAACFPLFSKFFIHSYLLSAVDSGWRNCRGTEAVFRWAYPLRAEGRAYPQLVLPVSFWLSTHCSLCLCLQWCSVLLLSPKLLHRVAAPWQWRQ